MYGWLLESVQHFIVEECGEDIWETILQDVGAKNTVFNTRQQYPDTLMLRLASALARFTKDPNSPTASRSTSPAPRKSSIKSKPSWRSASVNTDGRPQNFKCFFSATNALTEVTKKEIEAYNSAEEIRIENFTRKRDEDIRLSYLKNHRRSLVLKLDDFKPIAVCKIAEDNGQETEEVDEKTDKSFEEKRQEKISLEGKKEEKISFEEKKLEKVSFEGKKQDKVFVEGKKQDKVFVEGKKQDKNFVEESKIPVSCPAKRMTAASPTRKSSCTRAVEVYKRRGSSQCRVAVVSAEKLNLMREKFGTPEKAMHFFGRCFVKFFTKYEYDKMVRATGRYFCTFLQSVDSIHQRMRFTFPRMRSPTMQLTRAHRHGAELVYSSTRTGFSHYLMGQLYEIAEDIFSLKLKASIVKESMEGSYYQAVLRLEFDNSDYVRSLLLKKIQPGPSLPPVPASLLLQLFPFGVMLDRKMKIMMAGEKLVEAWGGPSHGLKKCHVSDILRLRKPKVAFTWDKVVCMQTMMFELELVRCTTRGGDARRGSQGARAVLLKGPIYFLEEIDALIFLCSPIFNDLEELQQAGLYLADMNGHGLSKEMLLHGWQHLSRLELLFEKAESRSLSLEKSRRLRDQWKNKGDQLLYSMIPRPVAAHLRAGKDPMAACQDFESVTIMFVGVQLTEAVSRADVMQTVAYMNDVYSRIDRLLDTHRVYKVETVGTVYMLVSGAPEKRRRHADIVAGAALAVSRAIPALTIGVHSGACTAGVLGRRLPRYCLVGDAVNTASRMQTTCEPGRIQISSATAEQLTPGAFRLRQRGPIEVKGKGTMVTFWLEGELEEEDQQEALQFFSSLCEQE